MSNRVQRNGRQTTSGKDDVEALYYQFLKKFYEAGDDKQAEKVAVRLEHALADSPDYAGSIRAEELRSLIAELRGDLSEAARSREAEIRRILELHSLAMNTPHWKYVARQYDFSDVSDRLDLLAILYDKQGDSTRAISTLLESKQYCESRQIPFDGQELLEELKQVRRSAEPVSPKPRRSAKDRRLGRVSRGSVLAGRRR